MIPLPGSLYHASLELLLLELGCSTSFDWSLHSGLIATLSTISLVQETWQFLDTHGLTLQYSRRLELPRLQDQFLMEAFIVHGVPVLDLVACNSCQMFLRAIFLSDIVTGDGVCISEDAWNGNLFLTPHKRRAWPQYGKPPRSCWETWRKWLKQILLGRGRRLKVLLGSWLAFDENWPWYRSSKGELLQFDNGTWLLHASIIRRN